MLISMLITFCLSCINVAILLNAFWLKFSNRLSFLVQSTAHVNESMCNAQCIYSCMIVIVWFTFTGTFAVVCVMVGGIVSKSGCGSSVDDYRAATAMTSLTSTGEDVYTSTATDNSLYYNITSSSGTSDASDDVMACNLAYATAAAMLIGIYQVYIELPKIQSHWIRPSLAYSAITLMSHPII